MEVEELNKKQRHYLKIKRMLSIIQVIIFSPFYLPLFIIVLLINMFVTKFHPFFTQERYGRNRKIFKVYKFRTINEKTNHSNAFARFLRFTSLDEIPQFLNILKGDMDLIGPRPLSIKEEDMDILRNVHPYNVYLVRPGLSGYAQINYVNESSLEKKASYDKYYIEHFSFKLDCKIFFLTIFKILPITIHKK